MSMCPHTRRSGPMGLEAAFDVDLLSATTRDTLQLFLLLARLTRSRGDEILGAHVVSMTHRPSDLLVVLWLSRWAAARVSEQEGAIHVDGTTETNCNHTVRDKAPCEFGRQVIIGRGIPVAIRSIWIG